MIRFRCLMFQRYNHFLFCQYFFKTLTKIFFQTLFFAPLQPYLIHYAGNIQNNSLFQGEQGRAAPRYAARYLPAPRPLLPAAPPGARLRLGVSIFYVNGYFTGNFIPFNRGGVTPPAIVVY